MVIWITIFIYVAAMFAIGLLSIKKADSFTNFVIGGRSAGAWVSAFSYGTTYFSAVLFIGYAGRSGWDFGFWAILIGVGNALLGSYFAWKVLANRTRCVTRKFKIKTMPQLFEKRYNSKAMKIYSAIVIFIFMVPYSASVYSGLSYLCESVLGIDYQVIMFIIALVAAIYLVLGGYSATLTADFVQGIIMIVGVVLMSIYVVNSPQVGGLADGFTKLTEIMNNEGLLSFIPSTLISLISLVLLTSIGSWGMPQMIHKFYGISDKQSVKSGTIISTVFALIISCSAYFVGSFGRVFFAQMPGGNADLIIPNILSSSLPQLLLGVVLVLVLSASVSTLSGITLTSSTAISMDIIESTSKKQIERKKLLLLTRVLCMLFIALSYVIASFKSPILTLMSFSWGSITGSFLAPYMLGLYWKDMNKVGAWSGMIGGLLISIIMAVASGFNSKNAPVFGVVAIIVSFVLCFIGSKIKNKRDENSEEFIRSTIEE